MIEIEILSWKVNLVVLWFQREKAAGVKTDKLTEDLSSTKHELLKVQDMLKMAESDLEKKVYQTAPFRNLKQMLQKKNEQLKDLRKRLSK